MSLHRSPTPTLQNAQGLLGFGEFLKYDEKEEKVVKKIVKRQWQPSALSAFAQHSFVQVSCGDDHYLALTTTGYVFTAGGGEQGELGRKVSSRASLLLSCLEPTSAGLTRLLLRPQVTRSRL